MEILQWTQKFSPFIQPTLLTMKMVRLLPRIRVPSILLFNSLFLFPFMTNFLSWNCRGFNNKRDEIRDIISDHHPLCFAFQETHLKRNDIVSIRSWSCFRKDFHHSERATDVFAFLISSDSPHRPIPLNRNIQALAVHIHIIRLVCTSFAT